MSKWLLFLVLCSHFSELIYTQSAIDLRVWNGFQVAHKQIRRREGSPLCNKNRGFFFWCFLIIRQRWPQRWWWWHCFFYWKKSQKTKQSSLSLSLFVRDLRISNKMIKIFPVKGRKKTPMLLYLYKYREQMVRVIYILSLPRIILSRLCYVSCYCAGVNYCWWRPKDLKKNREASNNARERQKLKPRIQEREISYKIHLDAYIKVRRFTF